MQRTIPKIILALMLPVALWSCSLDKDLTDVGSNGRIMFINASASAGPVNIQANATQVAAGLAFPNATSYITLSRGSYVVNASAAGNAVLSGTFIINGGGNYSLFVTDSAGRSQAAILTDNLTAPFADSANIRFVNLAPDGQAYDLYTGDSLISGGRHYNDQAQVPYLASFTEVRANYYNIQVRKSGTTTVVASFPGYLLRGAGIYTVYIVRPSGGGVNAYIITNL